MTPSVHPRNAGTPLAQDHVTLFSSPDPQRLHCYSPGLCRLPSGRLIATLDLGGPGVADLPGPKGAHSTECSKGWQGRAYASDDHGRTWTHVVSFPFMHARPFVAGAALYILGQMEDLFIIRSLDGGATWTEPAALSSGQSWHQAPCNVHTANGCVYLVMERRVRTDIHSWYVGEMAPVLMRGPLDRDLTQREHWTFASELSFNDVIDNRAECPQLDFFGVPFFACPYPYGAEASPGRHCAPIGWLETNVVQITDPTHLWHDPSGRTLHLWMRSHTGSSGYACIAKVVEDAPGSGAMTTQLERVPSGKQMLYLPCPGGQMKFHILYDAESRLYWLLSTQGTDSMARPATMPAERYNLPNNERRRLQLHFSTNLVDWCFAGLVAVGECQQASRHYASMVIDGPDLHVLSRSGNAQAKSAHDGNLITFHTVRDFRSLAY
jgi:hypothetical protein